MKPVSMKNTASDKDPMLCSPCVPPEYPYGLRICLNEASLTKLGLKELPALDSHMKIEGMVEVCSVSEEKNADGSVYRRLELQITDLAVGPEKSGGKDTAEKLYS